MEEIKRLEKLINYIKNADYIDASQCFDGEDIQALENLLTRYKQLEEENERLKNTQKILEHNYKVAIAETINKYVIKQKIDKLSQEDLEIYDTDSEDLVVAKYEQRAVLDTLQDLLREE